MPHERRTRSQPHPAGAHASNARGGGGENADDPIRFSPSYFVGKWNIEGVLPESPLSPAGEIAGTETFRHVSACTYEASLQAKGPAGAFTVKSLLVYDRRAGYMVKLEQDSRGFHF